MYRTIELTHPVKLGARGRNGSFTAAKITLHLAQHPDCHYSGNAAEAVIPQVVGVRVLSQRPGRQDPAYVYLTPRDAQQLHAELGSLLAELPADAPLDGLPVPAVELVS